MPKYQMTYERVTHWLHECEANSLEEAKEIFGRNGGSCIGEQETHNKTDIDEVDENGCVIHKG